MFTTKKTKQFISWMCMAFFMFCSCISENIVVKADTVSTLSGGDPVIQVTSYEITKGNPELDSEFTIKVTITNKNAYATAYNITVSAETDDSAFHLADGQVSQRYFQSLGANSSTSFEQSFRIEKTYPNRGATINYTFDYAADSGKIYSNTTTISPEITIPCKLKLSTITVSSSATLGSRSLISVGLVNDGTIDISSITMKLNGDIIDSQKNIDLGNLKSGEELTQDCYVNYLKESDKGIGISFEYKDESGNTYTIAESTYPVTVSSDDSSVSSSKSIGAGTINFLGMKLSIISFIVTIAIAAAAIYMIQRIYNNMKKGSKH